MKQPDRWMELNRLAGTGLIRNLRRETRFVYDEPHAIFIDGVVGPTHWMTVYEDLKQPNILDTENTPSRIQRS